MKEILIRVRLYLARLLIGKEITFVSNTHVLGDIKLLGLNCHLMNNRFRGKIIGRYDQEFLLQNDGTFKEVTEDY